jgi:LysR family glycine cleavage system transcriptional activator
MTRFHEASPTQSWTLYISRTYDDDMRSLPPLAAVRVFEAAARHENFTAAAGELAMSQAAVSYQVGSLEKRLGVLLFTREGKRVALSDVGRRLAAQLTGAFDSMDAAFASLRNDDEATLTVSTTVVFANAWFAWNLGSFQMANPAVAVRLNAVDAIVDFSRGDVDLAVRAGVGDWKDVTAEFLFDMDVTPMCSPAYLEAQGGTLAPADLLRLPLIGSDETWWPKWLAQAGASVSPGMRPGMLLDSQAHAGNAAIAGQGVAMLTPFFWRNDIADGKLVRPFALEAKTGLAYWLVYPPHRRNAPKVRAFREWLLPRIARDLTTLAR